ncbi:tautomerase family protein [Spongiactinospora sp. TRM90649]|uniref:tautomerase family protein n=1 Tax=Spongiactinospora sp. TRM90649 TaxID=3031114 RepID=UPI0023F648DB|nr:tautomerase family protein [Spongiactinospora sp. TRM90649]MDF5753554.1 tautomerase family protein [Spongiactinospora sp. TRM90649]
MPHISIKHFPAELTQEQENALLATVTDAVTSAFGVDEGVVSISLEPVRPESWHELVYQPEIIDHRHLLRKEPSY